MKKLALGLSLSLLTLPVLAVPVTETFEDESTGATSFSQGGYSFTLSGDFAVEDSGANGWGSGGSQVYIETGVTASSDPVFGAFEIDNANSYFQINSFDAWGAIDGGNNGVSGSIEFVGTEYLSGLTFTALIDISSSGTAWDQGLSLLGSNLENKDLISLSAATYINPNPLIPNNEFNYISLDNINFDITTTTPPNKIPEPATFLLMGAGLLVLRKRRTNT